MRYQKPSLRAEDKIIIGFLIVCVLYFIGQFLIRPLL